MTVKQWGDLTIVDLNWQGPKMFSRKSIPRLPSYRGVYLISSRKVLYGYPHGRSSLAYIGSGIVSDRIHSHVRSNFKLKKLLREEGTLRVRYASASRGTHPCVEQVLFTRFEQVRSHSLERSSDLYAQPQYPAINGGLALIRPCAIVWKIL